MIQDRRDVLVLNEFSISIDRQMSTLFIRNSRTIKSGIDLFLICFFFNGSCAVEAVCQKKSLWFVRYFFLKNIIDKFTGGFDLE